jgi:hypothetical protein
VKSFNVAKQRGLIDTRAVGTRTGEPKEADVCDDVMHAVHRNVERNSVNDAAFAQHLRKTHSKIESAPSTQHKIVTKASKLKWK